MFQSVYMYIVANLSITVQHHYAW